ncbi:MAG: ABC transporter permease [Myxococcales bacterium]
MLLLVALGADLIASDMPLAMRLDGKLFLLPNLTRPASLLAHDNQSLRALMRHERGDWLLLPPVPFGPYQTDLSLPSLPASPSRRHLLGTDEVGRDVLSRLVHGARVSLAVGLVSVALYVAIGLLLGALAGYCGGATDAVVSRAIEVMLTFPTILLALAAVALIERPTILHLILVLGLTRWPDIARLVRGEVLRIKAQDYVLAARVLGFTRARILLRHVLPNAMGPVLVAATFGVANAVLIESGLSFLGFGALPPTASWGELLTQAHRYAASPGAWWLAIFPGAAIFLTVGAFHLAGEALREELDPKEGRGAGKSRER